MLYAGTLAQFEGLVDEFHIPSEFDSEGADVVCETTAVVSFSPCPYGTRQFAELASDFSAGISSCTFVITTNEIR